jgi:hypothetical protein
VEIPETRYAKTADGEHIANQVIGGGPVDLVFVTWLLNVEYSWNWARRRERSGGWRPSLD